MKTFVTGGSGFLGRRLIRELVARGDEVAALARSTEARRQVEAAGAIAVAGDLDDVPAMTAGMRGCQVVFHCAALAKEWGPIAEFERANIAGTDNVLAAARAAGVKRLVHVSTEAVLLDGRPLVRVDESHAASPQALPRYPRTKALSERAVLAANGPGLETVVVRPRFIWGEDDTTLLPVLVEKVKAGQFAWIDGGHQLTSTCHVANCVEGMLLAADKGRPGEVYFLTDGEPATFRDFLGEMLRAAGVDPGTRSAPRWLLGAAAPLLEGVWNLFRLEGAPPLTRMALLLVGREVTVDDSKARRELGYQAKTTRAEGMAAIARSTSPPP